MLKSSVCLRTTSLFLLFVLFITPLTPAFAQVASEPSPNTDTTTITHVDTSTTTPSDTISTNGLQDNTSIITTDSQEPAAPDTSSTDTQVAPDTTATTNGNTDNSTNNTNAPQKDTAQQLAQTQSINPSASGINFNLPVQAKTTVDQSTGSLLYEYPIKLPDGRAGMTPELSLKYNSRNATRPDSLMGMGWETSIPYIVREPIEGTNNLYTKAYFSSSLSGNLIATTDTSSSQYTLYRPESDDGSYLKYTYNNDNTWTMTGKDGRTYTFGGSSASRQDNPSDSTKVYKWMVSKIVDPNGNEIDYTYTKDSGQIYPYQVTYTYNPSSPAVNSVTFAYTTPTLYGATVYNSGFAVTTYKLLNTITVSSTSGTYTTTDTYTMSYVDAQFLKQKLLSTINRVYQFGHAVYTQNFNDNTTFSYSTKAVGWNTGNYSLENQQFIDMDGTGYLLKDTAVADFDGNGFPDIYIGYSYNNHNYNHLDLNDGNGFTDSWSSWNLPNDSSMGNKYGVVDLNGDNLPDLEPRYYSQGQTPPVYLNTGSGFTADTSNTWFIKNYVSEAPNCVANVGDGWSYGSGLFLYDINHDGKRDIVYFGGSSNFKVYLNNGSGYTVSSDYTFNTNGATFTLDNTCYQTDTITNYKTLIDVNGDGLLDYFDYQNGIYLNTGHGFIYSADYSPAYSIGKYNAGMSGFADVNGDGLVDYVAYQKSPNTTCTTLFLNTGKGLVMTNPAAGSTSCTNSGIWSPAALSYGTSTSGILLDVTGDGYPDIVNHNSVIDAGYLKAISDAQNSWVTNSNNNWSPLIDPARGVYFDINSDGIMDFISEGSGWDKWLHSVKQAYLGNPGVPNQLTQINSPLGAQTVISYTTAPTNYSDVATTPIPVVQKVTTQNLGYNAANAVTQYAYSGGTYIIDPHTAQKRFAGFHKVTATESGIDLNPVRVTNTFFMQDNGSDSSTNEPTDDSLALIGKPYYTVTEDPSGTPKKETWNQYGLYTLTTNPLTNQTSEFEYPTQVVEKTTDSSTAVGRAKLYTYDTSIGEQTELADFGFVNAANDGTYTDTGDDSKYTFTDYATNGDNTIVKPDRVDIRASEDEGDTVARTDDYYDNNSFGTIGSLGNLTKEERWVSGNGSTVADTTYTYDSYGNVLTMTNPRNALTTYTYDSTHSLIASMTNDLNQTTNYSYINGKLTQVIDPNNRSVNYDYSNKGWLYRTTEVNTAGSRKRQQWLVQYNSGLGGWAIETSDTPIINTKTDYTWQWIDNLGRPIQLIRMRTNHATGTNSGYYMQNANNYDALGRQVTNTIQYGTSGSYWYSFLGVSLPSALTATTTYDVFDRPTSTVNALGTTTMAYVGSKTEIVDANNHEKDTTTDAYSNLAQVDEHNSDNTYTTTYNYDVRDLLTGYTDALGNIRNFTYNNAGWLTNSEDLHASSDNTFGSTSFTYDLNGNQLIETEPDSTVVTHVYDSLDRPTSIDSSSTTTTDYTFAYDSCTNGKGRVCTVSSTLPNSVTMSKTFVYGISGVPTSTSLVTNGNTYTTSYLYNYSDGISKITYPNNTIIRYAFGDWALPATVYQTLPGGSETTYATATYHFTLKPDTVTITSGPTISYTYDANKLYRESGMTATMGGNTLQSYAYTYDNVNNITQTAEPGLTKTYTYDDLNRLTQAVYNPGTTYSYGYDAIGNITSANGSSYTYNQSGNANPNAVTSVGSDTYTYDSNGNVASTPTLTIANNWQNQPSLVTIGSTNINMYYDETGERFIYQTPTSTETQVTPDYLDRGGVAEVIIRLGDLPIGLISNNTVYGSITDNLNTPVKQITSSGTTAEGVTYDPFGEILTQTGNLNGKRGYINQQEDADTGLSYLNARYYNPAVSRFTSEDPIVKNIGSTKKQPSYVLVFNQIKSEDVDQKIILSNPQSLNLYSYSNNNPITESDPGGKYWELSASETFLIYSGAVGIRFDNSGLDLFFAGGLGAGIEGKPLSVSNVLNKGVSHELESNINVGYSAAIGLGRGKSINGQLQNNSFIRNNGPMEDSYIIGFGADVYARQEVSIPILGGKSPNSDSALGQPTTYLSATNPQQSQEIINNTQSTSLYSVIKNSVSSIINNIKGLNNKKSNY